MNISFKAFKLEDKHKIFLFIVALLGLLSTSYYSVIMPQMEDVARLQNQYESERQRVQILETFALNHPDINKYVKELNAKAEAVDKSLPNDLEVARFLVEIESVSKAAGGVQLAQIKPAQAINKNGYREIPIEILVRGTFTQMLNFLKKLEETQRFHSIANMSIQSQKNILESKITVLIFSYGIVQNATPTPGAAPSANAKPASPPAVKN